MRLGVSRLADVALHRPAPRCAFDNYYFGIPSYPLAPNGWLVLVTLLVLNRLLQIDLGLKELSHLYEFHANDNSFSFHVRDPHCYLVTTVLEEDERGWNRELLKLVSSSGDVDVSPSGFIVDSKPLHRSYRPAPEEVKMEDIEKS